MHGIHGRSLLGRDGEEGRIKGTRIARQEVRTARVEPVGMPPGLIIEAIEVEALSGPLRHEALLVLERRPQRGDVVPALGQLEGEADDGDVLHGED